MKPGAKSPHVVSEQTATEASEDETAQSAPKPPPTDSDAESLSGHDQDDGHVKAKPADAHSGRKGGQAPDDDEVSGQVWIARRDN